MTKEVLVDKLLDYFIRESKDIVVDNIPETLEEKRLLLRGLINIREPYPLDTEILKLEDQLLQLELKEKLVTDVKSLKEIENKICLWQGDITTLKIEAIVNAGNSFLLGCFIPNHSCIDNAIHTCAGIRLRLACQELMQGKEEKIGQAKITPGFNLPSSYVIHTVGPVVRNQVTEKEIKELESCYISCLDLARENNIKTIAFPAISTGIFHFPKEEASLIAVRVIRKYLKDYPEAFERIVFNVFTKEDKEYYDRLFKN